MGISLGNKCANFNLQRLTVHKNIFKNFVGATFLTHPVYSFLSCTVTRDQRNWRLNGSVGIRQVILKLFLLCQVESDFDET